MNSETHILVDEAGIPILRGTESEIEEQHSWLKTLGFKSSIELKKSWDWSLINWGD